MLPLDTTGMTSDTVAFLDANHVHVIELRNSQWESDTIKLGVVTIDGLYLPRSTADEIEQAITYQLGTVANAPEVDDNFP